MLSLNNKKVVFVVGNSRSGTTMMGRIIGQSKDTFTFGELHFYGMLYSPEKDASAMLNKREAIELFSKLLCLQRNGFFADCSALELYKSEVTDIVNNEDLKTHEDVYLAFLYYETKNNNKTIPCEQTPKNLFFLNNIFNLACEAKVVNMVRDPRDVMNSQKSKWKRRFLGANGIPLKEVVRAWFNYHPITIALLWRSAILESKKFEQYKSSILSVKFENLLTHPSDELKKLCAFLGIDYDINMLNVPQIGSSDGRDSDAKGINQERINPWKNSKTISKTEVYFCEKYCFKEMSELGYEFSGYKPNKLAIMYYYVTFPLKMSVALLLNIKRMKSLFGTIKQYFFNKEK